MSASLVHTIRSIGTLRTGIAPVSRGRTSKTYTRHPTDSEQLVLKTLADNLLPTVLEPFEPFERPWLQGATTSSATAKVAVVQEFTARMTAKLESFIEKTPTLLEWHTSPRDASPLTTLSQIMAWRTEGHPYKAICELQALMINAQDDSDILRLHHADILWDLGLHDQCFSPSSSPSDLPRNTDKVKAALLLINSSAGFFEDSFSTTDFVTAISPAVVDVIVNESPVSRSAEELFAEIVYCHAVIIRYRFSCLMNCEWGRELSGLSAKAHNRLLSLWREIKDDPTRGIFLRWRCSNALHECLPFSTASVGLPARRDPLSLWANPGNLSDIDDRVVSEAVDTRRALQMDGVIDGSLLDPLERQLDYLIARNGFRGIDELLLALQMPVHPDFYAMQKTLRSLAWKLHKQMLPSAPWLLDAALLHPLSLWIGEEYRCGRTVKASWFRSSFDSRTAGRKMSRDTPLSRLQIGFGHLEQNAEEGARFVYAWSILYCCLQYTPVPLDEEVYRLLFVDHQVFSFSQLFNRVRQVCRNTLTDKRAFHHLTLDGFNESHRHVAGLGLVKISGDPSEKLDFLTKEITALSRLSEELQRLLVASPSQGLRHLRGMCLVYQGSSYLEKLAESKGLVGHHAIETDLAEARRLFQEAFEGYQDVMLGEITRRGGEGLIKVQYLLDDLFASSESHDAAYQEDATKSMLKLCSDLRTPLRTRAIQAYGTPTFRFEWEGTQAWHSLAIGPSAHASALYGAGERCLHLLGQEEEAFEFLHGSSIDMTMGSELAMSHEEMHPALVTASEPIPMQASDLSGQGREYVSPSGLPPPELPSDEFWGSLAPEINRAVTVQFSVTPDDAVVLHTHHQSPRLTNRVKCAIKYQEVEQLKDRFKWEKWDAGIHAAHRGLDRLVSGLRSCVQRDELVILLPGPVCRSVLLHVLEITPSLPLEQANTVVYAPDLITLKRCLELARARPRERSRRWRMAAATVWEMGRSPEAVARTDVRLCATVDSLIANVNGTTLKRKDVTKVKLQRALSESECLFFLGHGASEKRGGMVCPPALVLADKERFRSGDFPANLPGSLLVLFACSSGDERTRGGEELQTLQSAALNQGATTVVAARLTIWVTETVNIAKLLSAKIKEARQTDAAPLFNIAKALQSSVQDAREKNAGKKKVPDNQTITEEQRFAPYFSFGSPLINVHDDDDHDDHDDGSNMKDKTNFTSS